MAILKQGDKEYLEEHSKQKVAFYRKYLTHYLRVLLHSRYINSIHIYDVFCGTGIYPEDGSKGSPIVAVEVIQSLLKDYPEHRKPITLLINDIDSGKVQIAKTYIEENCNLDAYCRLQTHNSPANEILKTITGSIGKSSKKDAHLIFIDPHGYKDVRREYILSIMQSGRSEILLFLPICQMYRFLKPSKEDSLNRSYEPLRTFMKEFELEDQPGSQEEYIQLIKEAFTFGARFYTTSFVLQADKINHYALFLITSNIKGLEKAVEAKWELDDRLGKGHLIEKNHGLFDKEYRSREKLDHYDDYEKLLYDFLKQWRTNGEIYEFSLQNGFKLTHTNQILTRWNKSEKLEFDHKPTKINTFYLTYKDYKNEKYKVRLI